jgi:hypothetical protein
MGKRLLNRSSSRKIKLKEKINITTKIKQIKFYKEKIMNLTKLTRFWFVYENKNIYIKLKLKIPEKLWNINDIG